jgi:hypothetical protein
MTMMDRAIRLLCCHAQKDTRMLQIQNVNMGVNNQISMRRESQAYRLDIRACFTPPPFS